ncbi:MAG: PIN domain-containing protein [Candidatus Aenigmatarchaeota archaeon]
MPLRSPRLLIVDANILFSFFKKDSARRRIIKRLSNRGSKLISPDFVMEELLSDKEKIMRFAKINELEFNFLFSLLERKIETFSKSKYEEFISEGKEISPHDKDVPYFALALSLNSSIWSGEKAFKKEQSQIKALSTRELVELLES